jgi:membrane protease subunit HflC
MPKGPDAAAEAATELPGGFSMRTVLLLTGLALVAVLTRMSFFTVDPTEYVYVTEFGRHVATYDGADAAAGAGLHWRWPWPVQSVQRLDRRLQYFDLPFTELLTLDVAEDDPSGPRIGKNVIVETYACWRIAGPDAADRFLRSVGSPQRAGELLGHQINSKLGALISKLPLEELINSESGKAEENLGKLQDGLRAALKPQAEKYGIELVDVRLRRFNHPPSVRESIFSRIRSERQKLVVKIKSEGETRAKAIRNEAERKARGVIAVASREADDIRQKGENRANQARLDARGLDPELYARLQQMDELRTVLVGLNKSSLWLSLRNPLLRVLTHPWWLSAPSGASPPTAKTPSRSGAPRKGGD